MAAAASGGLMRRVTTTVMRRVTTAVMCVALRRLFSFKRWDPGGEELGGGTPDRVGGVVVGHRAAFETKAAVQKTNVPSKSAVVGMSVKGEYGARWGGCKRLEMAPREKYAYKRARTTTCRYEACTSHSFTTCMAIKNYL